jgi:branched-chain amino acid transport system ATP-binding protein
MAARTLLRVRGLHAGYGRAEVLHGLDVTADEGQVITVIGPNGAGKSTLLNALMGALPSRGTVEYQGESVALLSLEERVWRGMALVPETRALFATMSVKDNLLLGAWRRFRVGVKDSVQELNSVYMLFPRLRERRTQLAGTLSGGERQMLAVGRALMGKPSLLMLDEPSLGLAPLVVRSIFATIAALRSTGVTILLVEQNARAALEVADYGYVLEMGEVALQGPAEELARHARAQPARPPRPPRRASPAGSTTRACSIWSAMPPRAPRSSCARCSPGTWTPSA